MNRTPEKVRQVRWLWMIVLAVACLGLGVEVRARTVLDLDTLLQPVPLADWGDAAMDDSGRLDAAAAAEAALPWTATDPNRMYPLAPGRALWIRLTVPPAPDAERWYLEIPHPRLDRATLYSLDSAGQWQPTSAGDRLPVTQWPVRHRHPLLPLAISAEEPRRFLLRVENGQPLNLPVRFVSESRLNQDEQRVAMLLGVFFGLTLLAASVALISAISLRDGAYGWYALAVVLMALTQAALSGVGGLHLWPDSPDWADLASTTLGLWAIAALVAFYAAAVSMSERSRSFNRALLTLAFAGALLGAVALYAPAPWRPWMMLSYTVMGLISAQIALLWATRQGDRFAPWLMLGSLPVIVSGMFPLGQAVGLLPVGFLTTFAMQFGIALELPILLVILMLRSQQRREHRNRLLGLDRIDPATGLLNESVFMRRLRRMIERSQRLRHQGAVLLVDVVNMDQIRREFGRRAADELPLRVAGRLLSVTREIDSVARLAERRFGLLLEGPLGTEEAAAIGPRVVAHGLMPFKDRPLQFVAQLRVAQAMVPMEGTDPAELVRRLDRLLASVGPDSRRSVFTLRDGAPLQAV